MRAVRNALLIIILTLSGFILAGWISSLTFPKGSGLAGPGTVAGYAMFGAFGGLLLGIILALKAPARKIIFINIIFGLILIIPLVLTIRRIITTDKQIPGMEPNATVPVFWQQKSTKMGLGMVKPDFYNDRVLYFYAPNLEKSVDDHTPIDSLVFAKNELGVSISYAPPWFYPAHVKLDYDILYFIAIGRTKDWVQVEVNQQTGLTYWLDASSVTMVYWPDFLLNTFLIESIIETNILRVRPYDNASMVKTASNSFEPVEVKNEWVRVKVLDDDFNPVGEGWLRWKRGDELLIRYFLLS